MAELYYLIAVDGKDVANKVTTVCNSVKAVCNLKQSFCPFSLSFISFFISYLKLMLTRFCVCVLRTLRPFFLLIRLQLYQQEKCRYYAKYGSITSFHE